MFLLLTEIKMESSIQYNITSNISCPELELNIQIYLN